MISQTNSCCWSTNGLRILQPPHFRCSFQISKVCLFTDAVSCLLLLRYGADIAAQLLATKAGTSAVGSYEHPLCRLPWHFQTAWQTQMPVSCRLLAHQHAAACACIACQDRRPAHLQHKRYVISLSLAHAACCRLPDGVMSSMKQELCMDNHTGQDCAVQQAPHISGCPACGALSPHPRPCCSGAQLPGWALFSIQEQRFLTLQRMQAIE